ncbi:hypothetical protein OG203_05215 [Nocardia sp. NBC_01499]|uniref:hypothetical protein n=1 Tax=Nocardia sp. NBC_01499 TaxID=2903597 RepID=UPI00386C9827
MTAYALIGLWTATSGHAAPVPDAQVAVGVPGFIGAAVTAAPLSPKPDADPWISTMHGDTDNANTSNHPGPLGTNPRIRSATGQIGQFLWHRDGRLTSGYLDVADMSSGLAAVDPATMGVLAQWFPPPGEQLNAVYMSLDADDAVLVNSKQGHIYRVRRTDPPVGPTFTMLRDLDVRAELQPGEQLLNSAYDSYGNIWFTTGAIPQVDANTPTTATIGYVTPDDRVHTIHLADQTEEKGITVHGATAYLLTAPAGATDHPGAVGTLSALRAGPQGPNTLWQERFDAGSGIAPGGFARGSGTTPTVLGDRYVGIVDNADRQVHLLIYRQDSGALICRVPLFTEGASYTDIGAIGYEENDRDSLVVLNGYHGPPLGVNPTAHDSAASVLAGINNGYNNMNGMSPGVTRIDVADGACSLAWQTPERIKSVPVLSTRTGLVYGYTQDPDAAAAGLYVWYFEAIDFRTGRVAWKIRAGVGGTYNDTYRPGSLGPDGTFYQSVTLGVVALADAP